MMEQKVRTLFWRRLGCVQLRSTALFGVALPKVHTYKLRPTKPCRLSLPQPKTMAGLIMLSSSSHWIISTLLIIQRPQGWDSLSAPGLSSPRRLR